MTMSLNIKKHTPYFLIGIVFSVIYLPVLFSLPAYDSTVFLYMGQRILDGFIPYKDAWDHKPPMIYWINALGLYLGQGSFLGVRLIEFLSIYLAAVIGYKCVKDIFGANSAFFATIIWIVSLQKLLDGGNLTESYSLIFQFSSFALFIAAEKKQHNLKFYFIIGILGACVFFLRQNLVGLWLAIGFFLVYQSIENKNITLALYKIVSMASGFFLVASVIVIYFFINNSLHDFFDGAFAYNFYYSSNASLFLKLKSIFYAFRGYYVSPLVGVSWIISIYFLIKTKILDKTQKNIVIVAIILFPLEMFLSSLSGRYYVHYFMAHMLVVFVLLSFFFSYMNKLPDIIPLIKRYRNIFCSKKTIPLILFCLVLSYTPKIYTAYSTNIISKHHDNFELVVSNLSVSEEETILVWGRGSIMYYLLNSRAPTKFFYQYPLVTGNYTTDRMLEVFLSDLYSAPPKYIIDINNPLLPSLENIHYKKQMHDERYVGGYIPFKRGFLQKFELLLGKYKKLEIAEISSLVVFELK